MFCPVRGTVYTHFVYTVPHIDVEFSLKKVTLDLRNGVYRCTPFL